MTPASQEELEAFTKKLFDEEEYDEEQGVSHWPLSYRFSDEDFGDEKIQCGKCTQVLVWWLSVIGARCTAIAWKITRLPWWAQTAVVTTLRWLVGSSSTTGPVILLVNLKPQSSRLTARKLKGCMGQGRRGG